MVQVINKDDRSSMLGRAVGSALSETIPKEVERYRLSRGLDELAANSANMSPFQKYAKLASTPGATPSIIEGAARLLEREGVAEGFRNHKQNTTTNSPNPFRETIKNEASQQEIPEANLQPNSKGLVSAENTQEALKNYIPRTREQNVARAAELYDQNRQFYPDPNMAYQAALDEDKQMQAISQAKQQARQSQIGVEDRVRGQLSDLRQRANAQVPDNVYKQIENDVLDKIRNGVPELQASKEGEKKLDEISREYSNVDALGNWSYPLQKPGEAVRSLESSRQKFKKRDDLENFADTLISKNGLSPSIAYWKAFDIKDQPALYKDINSLPSIEGTKTEDPVYETEKLAPKLARLLGKDGSPLAVAEELRARGYDPSVWMKYLVDNQDQLNLSLRQSRQLQKTVNTIPSMNDLWFLIGEGKYGEAIKRLTKPIFGGVS